MSFDRRLSRLELMVGRTEGAVTYRVIVYTSGLNRSTKKITDEDREIALEITTERERQAWPHGILHSVITPDDLLAWQEGRKAEAVRGIGHREYGGRSGPLATPN